ncbi:uncharacterized protein LOC125811409 [Solanum verrucosum]|uniref:uncharacterized protein LOC125811409 n=1 Tax=Solanum verrucosum TaxID=315347 RepID=UPI0020D01977|nr:uncharacterized protein LOC125811409 [Solanum verrucosum]
MPPRRAVRGRPARRNVEEQELPNATKVQPQGEVTNTEFCEAIQMLCQAVTNKAPEMVKDMRSRMSLFVAGLGRLSRKERRAAMLSRDMDISRLMVYVQQVEEENLRDREEFKNKKAKTRNESRQQKGSNFRAGPAQSQGSIVEGGSWAPVCCRCGRNHSCKYRDG